MRKIQELVDVTDEELCSAKEYAERSLELRASGNSNWANKFKAMANDELNHAMNIHEYTIMIIEELRKVYTPPEEMQEKWDKCHVKYVEKAAWIRQMLAM